MIEDYLRNKGVEFEVIRHELAYTAQETAATEYVSGHMFAKTVIVIDGQASTCSCCRPRTRWT
jgi:hypothetical protein